MSLLGLSDELLVLVAEALHPASHLNFALASTRLHRCCQGPLSYHEECAKTYGVQSDLLPLAIPTLLQTVLSDPIAAWHIHVLDLWGHRRIHSHWTTYDFSCYKKQGGPARVDVSGLANSFYHEDELATYTQKLVSELYCNDEEAATLVELIRNGSQEPLKLLLIASCPRLRSLKYHEYSSDDSGHHPLKLLGETLRRISSLPHPCWPSGFASIKSLAIGVGCADHWTITAGYHQVLPFQYASTTPNIAPVTLFPSIESLFIGHLQRATLTDMNQGVYLLQGRSTLQHFYFGHSHHGDCTRQDVTNLLGCAKQIKSVIADHDFGMRPEGEGVISWLSKHHATSLQSVSLAFSHSLKDSEHLQAPDPSPEQPLERQIWERFGKLRFLSMDMKGMRSPLPSSLEDAERSMAHFASSLSQSVEVIVVGTSLGDPWSDDILAAFLCGKTRSNLKAVFLSSRDTSRESYLRTMPQTSVAKLLRRLPRSVRIAQERNIMLHISRWESQAAWDALSLFCYGREFKMETHPGGQSYLP